MVVKNVEQNKQENAAAGIYAPTWSATKFELTDCVELNIGQSSAVRHALLEDAEICGMMPNVENGHLNASEIPWWDANVRRAVRFVKTCQSKIQDLAKEINFATIMCFV